MGSRMGPLKTRVGAQGQPVIFCPLGVVIAAMSQSRFAANDYGDSHTSSDESDLSGDDSSDASSEEEFEFCMLNRCGNGPLEDIRPAPPTMRTKRDLAVRHTTF